MVCNHSRPPKILTTNTWRYVVYDITAFFEREVSSLAIKFTLENEKHFLDIFLESLLKTYSLFLRHRIKVEFLSSLYYLNRGLVVSCLLIKRDARGERWEGRRRGKKTFSAAFPSSPSLCPTLDSFPSFSRNKRQIREDRGDSSANRIVSRCLLPPMFPRQAKEIGYFCKQATKRI